MTDPTPTIEPINEPGVDADPARSLIIQLQFETEGSPNVNYSARVDQPAYVQPADFAKSISEIVERTTLIHLGALPVLAKQEPTPEVSE